MRLDLPPAPYDFHRSTFRYRTFGDDVASVWHDGGLYRVLGSGLVVRVSADGVTASAEPAAADHAELLHILGTGFDLEAFAAAYPDIYARAPGFRPPLSADPFESLVIAVTAQQISLRAACAIRNRFVQRFGVRHELDGVEVWAFPRQEAVAGADLELRAHLTELPGIGGWTVDWFLARTLGRPDAFAAGDLGVRKAVARSFSDDAIWPEARVREACLTFGEHANLAVHYLLVPPD